MDVCSLLVAVYVCVCVCRHPCAIFPTGAKRMFRCLVLTRTELRKGSNRRLCNQYYFKIPLAIGNNMSKAFC